MHSADKNLSVHTYIYFFAKLSALCTKHIKTVDIQHVAQCRHHQKPYTPLCAHASAQCDTTKRERFYGIGRQKNLFFQQKFRSPYTIKPLSFCGKLALCIGGCTQWCIQFQHLSTRLYALIIKGLTSKSVECRQNGKLEIVGVSVCTNLSALVYTCLHLSTLVFYITWSFARQLPRHNVHRRQRHLLCHPHNRHPRHKGRVR